MIRYISSSRISYSTHPGLIRVIPVLHSAAHYEYILSVFWDSSQQPPASLSNHDSPSDVDLPIYSDSILLSAGTTNLAWPGQLNQPLRQPRGMCITHVLLLHTILYWYQLICMYVVRTSYNTYIYRP